MTKLSLFASFCESPLETCMTFHVRCTAVKLHRYLDILSAKISITLLSVSLHANSRLYLKLFVKPFPPDTF